MKLKGRKKRLYFYFVWPLSFNLSGLGEGELEKNHISVYAEDRTISVSE